MNEKQMMVAHMNEYLDGTYDDISLLNYRLWFINHYQGVDIQYDRLKTTLLKDGLTMPNGDRYALIDTYRLASLVIPDNYKIGETKLPITMHQFIDYYMHDEYSDDLEDYGFEKLSAGGH